MKALRLGVVLLAAWAMGLLTFNCIAQHFSPPQRLPLVHSAAVNCGPPTKPLLRSRQHNYDYRLGVPFNDKGVS